MEDLFELAVVLLIFVFGAVAKNKKNKQKKAADKPKAKPVWQTALAQTAPVQPAEPVVVPLESLAAPAAPRQDFESAFTALSDLLDLDEKPSAAAKPAGILAREQTSIEAETAMKQRTEIVRARVQESLSGQSAVDEHGCIGGSMPDHNAEGERFAEHAAHERNRQQKLAEEIPVRAESLRRPTAQDLRKAVVMSEILDKPVSLRRRRI